MDGLQLHPVLPGLPKLGSQLLATRKSGLDLCRYIADMAAHAFTTTPCAHSALRSTRRSSSPQQRNVAAAGVSKKVNTLDENWKKVQCVTQS